MPVPSSEASTGELLLSVRPIDLFIEQTNRLVPFVRLLIIHDYEKSLLCTVYQYHVARLTVWEAEHKQPGKHIAAGR